MARKQLTILIGTIVATVLVGNTLFGLFLMNKKQEKNQIVPIITSTPTSTPIAIETVLYEGEEGKEALVLLKEQATVEQDASGLVIGINGRKADSEKREYWAFYVNGELAPLGPAEYETKEGDIIEWKIETY